MFDMGDPYHFCTAFVSVSRRTFVVLLWWFCTGVLQLPLHPFSSVKVDAGAGCCRLFLWCVSCACFASFCVTNTPVPNGHHTTICDYPRAFPGSSIAGPSMALPRVHGIAFFECPICPLSGACMGYLFVHGVINHAGVRHGVCSRPWGHRCRGTRIRA